MTPKESKAIRARQKAQARILGLVLGGLALLFFFITIAKLGMR